MNYKTILMAHDFSDSGGRALERAAELARAHGATLHLLHVVEYLPPVDTSFGAVSPYEVDLTDGAQGDLPRLGLFRRDKPCPALSINTPNPSQPDVAADYPNVSQG